mgnify:CR=1 FL=1
MRSEQNAGFKKIVNDAALVVPDSVGVVWACRRAGAAIKERVPGIDILYAAARENSRFPWRIFFLGALPGVAEAAAEKLRSDYPGFNVVGTHHGYFKDNLEVIEKIKAASPDVLFIAMGSPAQEEWFVRNAGKLGNVVAIGVGGSFDVASGNLKRAPAIFQRLGLEWLHRLITQPSRIYRMLVLPVFAIKVILAGSKIKEEL